MANGKIPDWVKGVDDFCPKDCPYFEIGIVEGAEFGCLKHKYCEMAVEGYKELIRKGEHNDSK